jgi:hypothetical protein
MICQESGQEDANQGRLQHGLQPLIIPNGEQDRDTDNPFSADPANNGQSSRSCQSMVDIEGMAAGPFHQLNLTSRSVDETEASRSPTLSMLSRSQSEVRASPLRKYDIFAC